LAKLREQNAALLEIEDELRNLRKDHKKDIKHLEETQKKLEDMKLQQTDLKGKLEEEE
jgi:hypothetical protein